MKKQLERKVKAGFSNPLSVDKARQRWREVREGVGLSPTNPKLLTPPLGNAKWSKGGQYGLCLLPHRLSGENLCKHSTPGCRELCLNLSGRGYMAFVQQGRLARSRLLIEHPAAFATLLTREIMALPVDAKVRLNAFSDIRWEEVAPDLFEQMARERPDLLAYDYTKHPVGSRNLPDNYHVTYSASERWSDDDIVQAVEGGSNVAVVWPKRRKEALPDKWNGLSVVDGDVNDSRYEDPKGVVVGLRAKGKAVGSDSGFVRQL